VNAYHCSIDDGSKIGTFVEIQKGVTIGENALLGAGAVVTKDVPTNALVLGNPAKFVHFIG